MTLCDSVFKHLLQNCDIELLDIVDTRIPGWVVWRQSWAKCSRRSRTARPGSPWLGWTEQVRVVTGFRVGVGLLNLNKSQLRYLKMCWNQRKRLLECTYTCIRRMLTVLWKYNVNLLVYPDLCTETYFPLSVLSLVDRKTTRNIDFAWLGLLSHNRMKLYILSITIFNLMNTYEQRLSRGWLLSQLLSYNFRLALQTIMFSLSLPHHSPWERNVHWVMYVDTLTK